VQLFIDRISRCQSNKREPLAAIIFERESWRATRVEFWAATISNLDMSRGTLKQNGAKLIELACRLLCAMSMDSKASRRFQIHALTDSVSGSSIEDRSESQLTKVEGSTIQRHVQRGADGHELRQCVLRRCGMHFGTSTQSLCRYSLAALTAGMVACIAGGSEVSRKALVSIDRQLCNALAENICGPRSPKHKFLPSASYSVQFKTRYGVECGDYQARSCNQQAGWQLNCQPEASIAQRRDCIRETLKFDGRQLTDIDPDTFGQRQLADRAPVDAL
jgi:hypothetical protein